MLNLSDVHTLGELAWSQSRINVDGNGPRRQFLLVKGKITQEINASQEVLHKHQRFIDQKVVGSNPDTCKILHLQPK